MRGGGVGVARRCGQLVAVDQTCEQRAIKAIPRTGGIDRFDLMTGDARACRRCRRNAALAAELQHHVARTACKAPVENGIGRIKLRDLLHVFETGQHVIGEAD